ncbi:rRNA maturation RNase YbeY [Ilumatobacter sp.]|uniref:rRNA maturation RNase YbeY n=1 Tax=Ilumatobacter sp. TaxID=1967498 RepID=UPI0037516319
MKPSADDITVVAADERSADDSPRWDVDVERWQQLAHAALLTEGASGELTLTFIDLDDMAELNAEHMGKIGPTDVLSFPLDDEPMITPDGEVIPALLGDVVLSPAVAGAQFADHAGTYEDEIALLVVHGVLHILGHDHAEPAEAATMRARELALLIEHHWGGPPPAEFRQLHVDQLHPDQLHRDETGEAAE